MSQEDQKAKGYFSDYQEKKGGFGGRDTTLILSVKSFDNIRENTKRKKEKICHIKYVKDLL